MVNSNISRTISVLIIRELPKSVHFMTYLPVTASGKTRGFVGRFKYLLCSVLHQSDQLSRLLLALEYFIDFSNHESFKLYTEISGH